MTYLRSLAALLMFRGAALTALAAKRAVLRGMIHLAVGYGAFAAIRNLVYAELQAIAPETALPGMAGSLWSLNVLQAVVFLSLIYVPAVICLSNAIAGDGLGLSVSKEEFQTQLSALSPLWGTLFLFCAPLQLLAPQFVVLGAVGISIALLVLILLLSIYSIWAIRELNHISAVAALGVFMMSWLTLPAFYLLSTFFYALPLFFMLPLGYWAFQRFRSLVADKAEEQAFQRHLHALAANPKDADALYQLGLSHLKRGNLEAAQRYFENAVEIDSGDPDYHFYLGRVLEAKEDWAGALDQYEETYRGDSNYGQGDIFREVGKGYLQIGKLEKAIEFLQFFLGLRSSDPEGRYWLAVALHRQGKTDEMRIQLATILEQARLQPRFFRKAKREWVQRSRTLLRRP
jgi:tetratricopeptide (TPR) repeat protein